MVDIGITDEELNDVVFWSLIGGASAFTPVPGGIRIPILRHLMVAAQLSHGGIQQDVVRLTTAAMKNISVLARGPPTSNIQKAQMAAYYGCCCCVLEQMAKKCCMVFTVKDAVEDTTKLLHEGWLLAHALKRGYLSEDTMQDPDEVWRIREAILEACKQVDTSPFSKAIMTTFNAATGRDSMKETAQTITGNLHGTLTREGFEEALETSQSDSRQELQGLSRQLADIIEQQRPYLQKFEGIFAEELQRLHEEGTKPSASLLCCQT